LPVTKTEIKNYKKKKKNSHLVNFVSLNVFFFFLLTKEAVFIEAVGTFFLVCLSVLAIIMSCSEPYRVFLIT
jgi:hypothetical protein